MNPDKDQIKKVFASKLTGIEQDPPAFMWEKIESGLIDQGLKPKARTLRYKIAGWSTVAAAAVIIFGVFLFLPQEDKVGTTQVAIVNSLSQSEDTKTESVRDHSAENPLLPETPVAHKQKKSNANPNLLAQANATTKKENIQPEKPVSEKTQEQSDEKSDIPSSVNKQMLAASVVGKKEEEKKTNENEKLNADLQKQIEAFEAEGIKAEKLLADNAEVKSETSSNKGLDLGINGGGAFSKADGYKRTIMATANADQQLSLRSETVKLEHNQPINFGLSVNKRINDKLSIESGITYTYLSSKIKSKSASAYSQNNSQYFHYLGIPLTLNYNVFDWNKVRFYISAGGAIQKDIYGRLDRSSGVSQSKNSSNKSISQKNAQMSLNSSIGISYPIYGNMSLYTTVGGAYYIDAKNDYETIFSDKKWLLNLNLGIKFGF